MHQRACYRPALQAQRVSVLAGQIHALPLFLGPTIILGRSASPNEKETKIAYKRQFH